MESRKPIIALLILLALTVAASHLAGRARQDRRNLPLLYLPSGQHLKVAVFGFDNLVADALYLWAIQFYSDLDREDRFTYLDRILDNIVTLDPRFMEAYHVGAMLYAMEAGRPEAGVRFLERGYTTNPDSWFLMVDAGFYAWLTLKNVPLAEQYFREALRNPECPRRYQRILAGLYEKGERTDQAFKMWREIYEQAEDPDEKAIGARHLFILLTEPNIKALQELADRFKDQTGRFPIDLQELVKAGYLEDVPLDPSGKPYRIDGSTGTIQHSGSFELLPEALDVLG